MMLFLRFGALIFWVCALQACVQSLTETSPEAKDTKAFVTEQVVPCVQVLQHQEHLAHIPQLTAHVVDGASVFSMQEREQLTQTLWQYERETGTQLVVLSTPDLQSESMFAFAHRVACTYRVGRKGVGDGVILVIAPNQRQLYLYVMRDVEPFINHAQAQAIVAKMTEQFRHNRGFYRGVDEAMGQVMASLRGRFPPPVPTVVQ